MTNADLDGDSEFGNAKSAFHAKSNSSSASRYLLAWADGSTGSSTTPTYAALVCKLPQDEIY
jgi:hypothetical protein